MEKVKVQLMNACPEENQTATNLSPKWTNIHLHLRPTPAKLILQFWVELPVCNQLGRIHLKYSTGCLIPLPLPWSVPKWEKANKQLNQRLSYIEELHAHCTGNAVWLNFLFSSKNGEGKRTLWTINDDNSKYLLNQRLPSKRRHPEIMRRGSIALDKEPIFVQQPLYNQSLLSLFAKNHNHFDIAETFLQLRPHLPTQNWHNCQEKLWSLQTTWIYQSSLTFTFANGLADEPDTSVKFVLGGTGLDY